VGTSLGQQAKPNNQLKSVLRLLRSGFRYGFDFFTRCFLSSMFRVSYSVFFSLFRLQRTRELYVYEGNFNHFEHKLCETKPNSEIPKMSVSAAMIITNNKILMTIHYPKQSQTNPNQSQFLICRKGSKAKSNPNLSAAPCGGQTQILSASGGLRSCALEP
jgi:hypothetical protein